MTSELLSFSQSLLDYMLVLSLQLLIILLLRKPVARHFGAVTAYRMWALPLLWMPFHWIDLTAVNWSALWRLLPAGGETSGDVTGWVPQSLAVFEFDLGLPTFTALSQQYSWTSWLWLAGSIVWLSIAGALLVLQFTRIRQFSAGLPALVTERSGAFTDPVMPGNLQACYLQGLGSPALFGIFRPRLLLPADFEERYATGQRTLILKHEAVHLQRRDNLWNLLATLLRLVFWFNPLLHFAWKRFRLDQELSCDERVLQETNPDEGRQYARTLLDSISSELEFKHQPTITAWGSLREIRERTQMIRYHINKKPRHRAGKWLLLCCVLGGSLITAIHNDGFREVIAADNDQPEEFRSANVLSQEVYEPIERAQELRDQGEHEAALEEIDSLREMFEEGELSPYETFMMWQFYASIAMDQDNYTLAIDYWQNALEIADSELGPQQSATVYLVLGQLFYHEEQYPEAVEHLLTYKEVAPEPDDGVWQLLATAYYVQENNSEAVDHMLTYLEVAEEPDYRAAYGLITASYFRMERYEEIVPWAEKTIALDDATRDDYDMLYSLYVETDRMEDAEELQQVITERFGEVEE